MVYIGVSRRLLNLLEFEDLSGKCKQSCPLVVSCKWSFQGVLSRGLATLLHQVWIRPSHTVCTRDQYIHVYTCHVYICSGACHLIITTHCSRGLPQYSVELLLQAAEGFAMQQSDVLHFSSPNAPNGLWKCFAVELQWERVLLYQLQTGWKPCWCFDQNALVFFRVKIDRIDLFWALHLG